MSDAQKATQVQLEERYRPVGIKAVLAAAMMCANKNNSIKPKPAKAG